MARSIWILRIPGTLLLLLIAAALKAWGLGVDPVGRMGWFSTPEAQLAIIEFEILLGVWLWSGANPIGAWITALGTFAVFVGFSGYLGYVGQSSCGCFGRFSPSPWFAFWLDTLIIGLLVWARPEFNLQLKSPHALLIANADRAYCAAAAICIWIAGLVWAQTTIGSLPAAIAHMRGELVSISPRLVEMGVGGAGEERTTTVEVWNWNQRPVRLVGGTTDCACTVVEDLPVMVPAGEGRMVSVSVTFGSSPGVFTRQAALLVEDEGLRPVFFGISGRVVQMDH